MEEVWRDTRWIMDALQYARYKQPTGGVSISWIIDFSKEVLPKNPPSTSSQPDFMPSPMPSPEPCRKHSGQNRLETGSWSRVRTMENQLEEERIFLPPSVTKHTRREVKGETRVPK